MTVYMYVYITELHCPLDLINFFLQYRKLKASLKHKHAKTAMFKMIIRGKI